MRHHAFRILGPFHVPGLRVERRIRVYVPPEYSRRDAHPALYLFDGQNLFDDASSFAGAWRLHEVIDRMAKRKKRLPVLIGIDHGHVERIAELSPWSHGAHGGHADFLVDWIADTLRAKLIAEFGLDASPAATMIGGSSMGGLGAFYAHFRRPDVFGGAMCMSPSFWVAGARVFDWYASQPMPMLSRVYLDCGAREAGGRMLQMTERMARMLAARGYGTDRLLFRADPRGNHNERAWNRRSSRALRFLFPAPKRRRTGRRALSMHPMAEPDIW